MAKSHLGTQTIELSDVLLGELLSPQVALPYRCCVNLGPSCLSLKQVEAPLVMLREGSEGFHALVVPSDSVVHNKRK